MRACWSRPARTCWSRCAMRSAGLDLGKLREAVEREFVNLDENERQVRAVLARLESGFVRHFAEFHRA